MAASATLTATGAITDSEASPAIDTHAANGTITLIGTSLGALGNSIELRPGTGNLNLTASTGGIYVDLSSGNLLTSQITTLSAASTAQTIALSTTNGTITLDNFLGFNANTADDNFFLTTNGNKKDIAFNGETGLAAASATIMASGAITTSGAAATDIDTSGDGDIVMNATSIGASGFPIEVNPGSTGGQNTLSLTATTGNVYVDLSSGNLATSQITTLDVAGNHQTISLSTTNGSITIDSTSQFNADTQNDGFVFTANGTNEPIAFSGSTTLTTTSATLTATGAITSGTAATDIDTSAANGTITLSGASIGGSGNSMELNAGTGSFALTASTGGVFVDQSVGNLLTNKITTLDVVGKGQTIALSTTNGFISVTMTSQFNADTQNDNFILTTNGTAEKIAFNTAVTLTAASATLSATGPINSGTAATDIDTSAANGAISLTGTSLGTSAKPMELSPGTGTLSLTASTGGVFADLSAGNLSFSKITTLSVAGTGQSINLSTTNGSITVDRTAGFNANTQDDNFTLTTNGTSQPIAFSGATLTAASATLTATAAVTTTSAITPDVSTTSNLTLSSTGVGTSGNPLAVSVGGNLAASTTGTGAAGSIYVASANTLNLGTVSTDGGSTQTVNVTTTGASNDLNLVSSSTTNDNWTLTSGANLNFTGNAKFTANTATLSATALSTAVRHHPISTPAPTMASSRSAAQHRDRVSFQSASGELRYGRSKLHCHHRSARNPLDGEQRPAHQPDYYLERCRRGSDHRPGHPHRRYHL